MGKSKRSRVELYADVLRSLKVQEDGCRITRLAYASNMPLDRMKKVANELISHGLVSPRVDDPSIYVITKRGWEFLDAFNKLSMFLE